MSMATRCTSCGTIFRVVQDQLKVSEGWVRCGRCNEVFNALEGLFDLEREAPPAWAAADPARAQADAQAHGQSAAELDEEDRIASRFFRPEQGDVEHSPAESVSERDRMDFADARFNTELLNDAEGGSHPAEATASAASAKPAFLRHAERQARWRRPLARRLLWLTFVSLSGLLALQVAHHFRDLLAAQWPGARPPLAAWCELADCRIEAPRRIEDITVESTALARAAPGVDSFRLSVTLRNRGTLAVATPAVELSLTDASGQLIARRALAASDFRPAVGVIQSGTETALQVLLSVASPRVTGYTVEVFYP